MVKGTGKKKKVKRIVLTALGVLLLTAVVVLGILWNRYLNKTSYLAKFQTPQKQQVYLLGTFHETHFNKWVNYSMQDVLSVVKNVQPDVVLIEAREEYFNDYGVVDGPVDMAVVYSYCLDHNISVRMIDWWVVDNQYKSGTTSAKRDDHMFQNIEAKLTEVPKDSKVLVVCGAGHYYEQTSRFSHAGFKKQPIEHKSSVFRSGSKTFEYPKSAADVWKKHAYFYAYTYPEIIARDDTLSDHIKSEFTDGNHDAFYRQQLKYCDLFSRNKLYQ